MGWSERLIEHLAHFHHQIGKQRRGGPIARTTGLGPPIGPGGGIETVNLDRPGGAVHDPVLGHPEVGVGLELEPALECRGGG